MRISLVTAAMALTAFAAGPAQGAPRLLAARASARNPTSVVRVSPQGKLVRTVVTPAALITTPNAVDALVGELAAQHQVDPLLVHAVIRVESNYNQFALSDKGAQGYMQLIPPTARLMGVQNAFDPRENIAGGVKYLRTLIDRFPDLRHAIAAYNAGPEAVERYQGIPPYTETQNYVYLVADQYNRLRRARPAMPAQVAESHVELAPEPEHRPLVVYTDADGRMHLETQ
jgi:soluble lytic murein transglycosylase-like protein